MTKPQRPDDEIDWMLATSARLSHVFGRHCPATLPYDGRIDHWPAFAHGSLVRAHYALETTRALRDREFDAAVLTRVLYEHVVTMAWVAIDPNAHLPRQIKYEAGRRRAAAAELGQLDEPNRRVAATLKDWNDFAEGVSQSAPDLRSQAVAADRHWRQTFAAFQDPKYALEGLYTVVYRAYSAHVHPTTLGLLSFVAGQAPTLTVGRPLPQDAQAITIAPVIFVLGLLVSEACFGWPPSGEVYAAFNP